MKDLEVDQSLTVKDQGCAFLYRAVRAEIALSEKHSFQLEGS